MNIRQPDKPTEMLPAKGMPYDSRPLAAALATLSRGDIESMLGHVARLNITGCEDDMMRVVSAGLRRLTYFLDAVKQHKDETSAPD